MKLHIGQWRIIHHLATGGIVSGFDEWNETTESLMDLEILEGHWTGRLDMDPYPFFSLTSKGYSLAESKENPFRK